MPRQDRDWETYAQGQRALRRRWCARHYQPGRHHLGARLPAHAGAGAAARAPAPTRASASSSTFPSRRAEIFRTLPWRERAAARPAGRRPGRLPHAAYVHHFSSSLLRAARRWRRTWTACLYEGREVRLGVFPMGIDASRLRARWPETRRCSEEVQRPPGAQRRAAAAAGHRSAGLHQGHPPAAAGRAAAAGARAGLRGRAAAHPGRRAQPRRRWRTTPPTATRWTSWWAASTACTAPSTTSPSTTSTAPSTSEQLVGALPRGGRDARDAHPRRDEPGGQGVLRVAAGRGRRAGAERVRRRRHGAARGGASSIPTTSRAWRTPSSARWRCPWRSAASGCAPCAPR